MALIYQAGFDFIPDSGDSSFIDRTDWFSTLGWYDLPDGALAPQMFAMRPGRFGYGGALSFETNANGNAKASKPFPDLTARSQCYMGVAVYGTDVHVDQHGPSFGFSYTGVHRMTVTLKDMGVVEVKGYGDAVLFTSQPGVFTNSTWNYFELGMLLADDTTGWVTLKMNTDPICELVDQATGTTGFLTANSVKLFYLTDGEPGNNGPGPLYDDLYVTDALGTQNVGFLGNCRVQALLPDGDSGVQEFSVEPITDANWEAAGNPNIDDTQYVYASAPDTQDHYTIDTMVNTPVVFGIMVSGCYRQDDATQKSVANVITSNAVESIGEEYFTPGSYAFKLDIWETDPDTTVAWLYTAVNALIIGPKVIS